MCLVKNEWQKEVLRCQWVGAAQKSGREEVLWIVCLARSEVMDSVADVMSGHTGALRPLRWDVGHQCHVGWAPGPCCPEGRADSTGWEGWGAVADSWPV